MQKISVCIIVIVLTLVNCILAQDTTAPMITSPARDTSFNCNPTINVIQKLTTWYQNAGGALATDNSGLVSFQGNFTLDQTITIFNNSVDVLCGNRRSVTISFTAMDVAGNTSVPTIATFQTIDTIGPVINVVGNVNYVCFEGIRDTMIQWIKNKAGYIATDLCSNSVIWSTFQYAVSDNNGVLLSGGGSINAGPYPMIPDGICSWTLNINFFVRDECGNLTITPGTTSFNVVDNVAPVFVNPPKNITVDCDKIPTAPNPVVIDYCDKSVEAILTQTSTQSPDKKSCGHYNYNITRSWKTTDACGNTNQHLQVITVQDTTAPTASHLLPVNISCSDYVLHPDSIFININDACSGVEVLINDIPLSQGCSSQFLRKYQLSDACNNLNDYEQQLNVIQNEAPIILKNSENKVFDCHMSNNLDLELTTWLQSNGGSIGEAICGPIKSFAALKGSYQINDAATYPGTKPSSLPQQTCPSPIKGFLRALEVDFVYFDTCGNVSVTSAIFGIGDSSKQSFQIVPIK
jgi:hypothetical protein